VLHCNDWQTALAPACLHYLHGDAGAASVMTIHNLAFQGLFAAPTLADLGLPAAAFVFDGVEFHDQLSFLKAGLQFADRLTTVSPTYALEIQETELGFGLDGLLRYRSDDLSGILNGIDGAWDPATDPHLVQRYDIRRLTAKSFNRRALRGEFALPDDETVPLLAVVSRLTHQKGIDLVLAIADQLLDLPAQLVILGSGEHTYEADCRALAVANPGRVAVTVGFDEALAHRIEAGADIFLMPSRFEPCGLNQMYSLRYGTPPVVRATGGLADTVIDAALAHGNGFSFAEAEPAALLEAVGRAVAAWRNRRRWPRLQRAGMGTDFSWSGAATAYLDVYRAAISHHAA
jgi:starch synthase